MRTFLGSPKGMILDKAGLVHSPGMRSRGWEDYGDPGGVHKVP